MNFHDVRFPAPLSIGSSGGPERRTEIVTLNNGFEERNSPWADSRRRYDAGLGVRSLDDLAEVVAFFEARHGQLYGFRWKDWADVLGPDEVRGLDLWQQPPRSVLSGDRFRVSAGCDKRAGTCRAKFSNFLNFRGFPHIPGEDWVTAYPKNGAIHDGASQQGG